MKLFTTGQFARFCGTSKDTLIFYDRQGLLKPRYVSDSGYRRYGPEQFYDFDLISMLKETGSSLAEIKQHLRNREPEKVLALLEEKKRFLEQESDRLARRRTMLEEMCALISEASRTDYDILNFAELEEERLELVPAQMDSSSAKDEGDAFVVQYSEYILGLGGVPQTLCGVLIDKEDLIAGRYVVASFFHRASRSTSRARLHVRPKGRYAVVSHRGDIKSHAEAYRRMFSDIEKAGLRVDGAMYAYDLMGHLVASKTGEYATKYCVRVE